MKNKTVFGALSGLTLAAAASAGATEVTVIIENLAPEFGTALTPVWVGFHQGGFDLYDSGAPASMELERIAEDGNTGPLTDLFAANVPTGVQGTVVADTGIPVVQHGETATMSFMVDPSNRYFSYASMIVPSNDAFVANGNPLAHAIFDDEGNFIGADFILMGGAVLDAGTEVNDEIPMNTAFFGQMDPDTGVPEDGVVGPHPGFLPPGSGGILDDPMFQNADFTQAGYQVARIRVIPTPGAAGVLALAGLAGLRRRR